MLDAIELTFIFVPSSFDLQIFVKSKPTVSHSPGKSSLKAWGQEQGQCWRNWPEQSEHWLGVIANLGAVSVPGLLFPPPSLRLCSSDPGHAQSCTPYHLCAHRTALASSVWANICTLSLRAHLDDNTDLWHCFLFRTTLELVMTYYMQVSETPLKMV